MGVPNLFRHFARRCPRAVEVMDPMGPPSRTDCGELMVDFNSLIHLSARAVPWSGQPDYESKVIAGCIEHVERLVRRMSPTAEVFLAIDGVPPRAKMLQQRARRYASDAARHSGRAGGGGWDTNAVTPGTRFMAALGASLRDAFAGDATFVVSGADEPGEGEQKIFERLRMRRGVQQKAGLAFVYGLDADLLLMAMTHPACSRIRIVRESDPPSSRGSGSCATMLQVVDVSHLAKHAAAEMARACGPGISSLADDAGRVREYVALCGLLGNDFVPALPSLSIRDGGVDAVVRAHGIALSTRQDLVGRCLSSGGPRSLGGFDVGVLSAVAEVLARDETGALEDRERRHAALIDKHINDRRGAREDGDDLFPLRNPPEFGWLLFSAGGARRPRNGSLTWREAYYKRLIVRRDGGKVSVEDVHSIATEYAATLAWSAAYMTRGECISVGWAYSRGRAPTALDVHLALLAPTNSVVDRVVAGFEAADRAHLAFRSIPELRATTDPAASWQLMQVLPPRSAARLLEPPALALAKSEAFSHTYPASFAVCTYLCERLHECPALLPAWSPSI